MQTRAPLFRRLLLCATVGGLTSSAATRYVWQASPHPGTPYASWESAAHVIQDAADSAQPGDTVLVTNGVYATGGRAVYGTITNRVAIPPGVTVQSIMGPAQTLIVGAFGPGTTNNGAGAIRCAYVGTNAVLSGFTLTNGHTLMSGHASKELSGGGAWCELSGTVTNSTLIRNSAYYQGGGAYSGILNNCTLMTNSTTGSGAGATGSTLNNCVLTANSATEFDGYGGGAFSASLNDCTLTANYAWSGGGVHSANLSNCTVTGNFAFFLGGGASSSALSNCTLTDNSARVRGGGADESTLSHCTITGNSATLPDGFGGGACYCTLSNCTVTGNSAPGLGGYAGGAYSSVLNNCIVFYNTAQFAPNYDGGTFAYSCTTPLPPGPGNLDAEPLLASATHLSAQSPCISRGSPVYASGVDIDGETWLSPPCIGADQLVAGAATGVLTMAIMADHTNVATGYPVSLVARNAGRISASIWNFGDGVVMSNRPFASHVWDTPGSFPVHLTGYNDTFPGGTSAMLTVQINAREVYYVNAANATPLYPYTNWAAAATNIQQAIDAGTQLGRLVRVTNGIYASGGRAIFGTMTNRVVVPEGVELRSENGPLVTVIEGRPASETNSIGDGAVRCVYIGTNAIVSGFTLTNGHTQVFGDSTRDPNGGAAWCELSGVITNCILIGNSAASDGGGALRGTLNNCTLTGNSAYGGGGASLSTLNQCTLSGNSASRGGATFSATLNYCTLRDNSAYEGGGAHFGGLNSCTLLTNSAQLGGAAFMGFLNDCNLAGNSASVFGGGTYGSTLNNCALAGNSALEGGGAYHSALNGCTVTSNSVIYHGGGTAWFSVLNNCTAKNNSAGWNGGGAYYDILNNCILSGNSAAQGGAADSATLNNCTVSGNSASLGGGVSYSTLTNCIVYYNNAWRESNYFQATFAYSCTMPLPAGPRNLANEPGFVDYAGEDLHLRSNSPCINAGLNAGASGLTDFDGNPRIVSGTVDLGVYEFQGPGSLMSYAWLQYYGLPIDGSADYADPDADGMNNWQEWVCGTSPTNALSALRLLSAAPIGTNVCVTWQSTAGVSYFLEGSTNLAEIPPFARLATGLPGLVGSTTFIDTNAVGPPPRFYRVGVGN
ncbi:MAG TPA: choice-of-anchor Q domain-containing protein [Verrucomicrobiae bacterium]